MIGQSGLGAHGSKLRHPNFNLILAKLIGPSFDVGQWSIDARERMLVGIFALFLHALVSSFFDRSSRKSPTSVTTPTAWPVPRSLTFVGTAGLMSTQTIRTHAGSMLPTAMECSMELKHNTTPASTNCAA